MGMKLSEWRLKMTEGVSSVLSKLTGAADAVSARFAGMQDKISGASTKLKGYIDEIPGLGSALN